MMTEIFEALAVIGDVVSEEDRVVHLLASLPESFNVLVTARWAVVTERLLHKQIKMSEKTQMYEEGRKALHVHNTKEWAETPIHLPFLSQDRTF